MKRISLLLSVFLVCICMKSQPAMRMRMFSMADGLPSNQISVFAEAPNGMMWIATWNGLCNYDGYRFNTFVAPIGAGQVLTSNRLRFIVPDNDGNVWLSSFDNRLYVLSSKEGGYKDCRERLEALGVKDFEVSFMHNLDNGAVWILGKNGINLRISPEKTDDGEPDIEVVPTSQQMPALCKMAYLANDGSEWLLGEHTARMYGGSKDIQMNVSGAYKTDGGMLIVGERIGLYNTQKEEFTEIALPDGIEKIHASTQLSGGAVVMATDQGLYSIDGKSHALRRISETVLTNIEKDSKDRLWSIADDGRVALTDCRRKQTVMLESGAIDSDWPRISADRHFVHEDSHGNIWLLLTGKTITYYDENTHSLIPTDLRGAGVAVFPQTQLNKVFPDRHKNLWFTQMFNVCMLSFRNNSFKYVPVCEGEETRALCTDHNGTLWAGTRQGHLAMLDSSGKLMGYMSSSGTLVQQPAQFVGSGIYSIYEDRKQRLWIGTRGRGLYMISGGRVQHFTATDPDPNRQTCGEDYFDINEDATGRLWFATYTTGLMYLEEDAKGGFRFVSARNCKQLALPDGDMQKIRRISNAHDGTLMIATADGLLTIDPKFKSREDIRIYTSIYTPDDTSSLMSHDVLRILPCRKSNAAIYVSTMGAGIQTIASKNLLQNALRFKQVDCTPDDIGNVMGMIEDEEGKVWVAGENRLYCLSQNDSLLNVFTASDWGERVEYCETKPCYNSKSNSIAMGTFGGVVIFRPDRIQLSAFTPSLVFSGILYQGDERVTPLIAGREINLPVEKHNAMVYFSALDYSDNSKIRYAYRIKELDQTWSYVGEEHCAPLSNMPTGHYTLEVRSTNSDGVWTDNNAELKIYVEPTFWQTNWAWLIYMLICAGCIYLAFYLIRMRNEHQVEKAIHERQLRFFTDISHQLRTPLTLIGGPVSEVLKTEKLTEKARNYLSFVEGNANKMLGLINQTLDLKKLQAFNEEVETPSPDLPPFPASPSQGQSVPFSDIPCPSSIDLTILIVEDNDELRYFLRTALSTHYNIIEAENGKMGLRLAAEQQPDFIITDIMMPEMDGITMLRRIKADQNICHIPIIILSARTADVYRIEGLKEGADDYITKPFSVSYLQVRVESIVRQRRFLQEQWLGSLTTPPADKRLTTDKTDAWPETDDENLAISPLDKHFTLALNEYINQHLADENLKIDDIANALNISRSVLYGKAKAIYGVTPIDIVRNIRITQACKMLSADFQKNIAEIAYTVGFSDPKYFARIFKQTTGQTPSEYRKENKTR